MSTKHQQVRLIGPNEINRFARINRAVQDDPTLGPRLVEALQYTLLVLNARMGNTTKERKDATEKANTLLHELDED